MVTVPELDHDWWWRVIFAAREGDGEVAGMPRCLRRCELVPSWKHGDKFEVEKESIFGFDEDAS